MKHWHETREVLEQLAAWRRDGTRAALATVVGVRGSAYRHEGAKLAVAEDGRTAGNVSGGCLEQDVREVALGVIRSGRAELRSYCSSADEIAAWDLGLGCEGQVDVLVEPVLAAREGERELLRGRDPFAVCSLQTGRRLVVTAREVLGDLGAPELNDGAAALARRLLGVGSSALHQVAGHTVFVDLYEPPPELVVLGAGDDARPLVRLAAGVGFRVVVVDRRPARLTPERFPEAARLLESPGEGLARAVALGPGDAAVVMTHNFADDRAYLEALVRSPVSYIGVLGPRQRTERMVQALAARGTVDPARIYGPVGLDIGTDGAEQVALAVIAEILAVRAGREVRSLRERGAPIHAPAG